MKAELMDGAPAGSVATCHPSGWVQTDIFTIWFENFIKSVKPTPELFTATSDFGCHCDSKRYHHLVQDRSLTGSI
jgi:hypothetical protein